MKKELREKVWKKYDCKCAYCGEDLEYKKMQVDHIAAKYLGGKDDIENYNPSCRQCNFYKGTFDIEGFKKQLATITERIKKPFIVRLAMKYGIISFKPFDGKFYYEKRNKMKQIINEKGEVLFEGDETEMVLAFNYLTKPFHVLAETMGLRMSDAYRLNEKYWNDKVREAKSFKLIDA